MTFIYALASILSAFLVFLIQPVVAKIALPTLGGTPVVWSGCMLFFQAVLLMGYGYAHILTGRVSLRVQPLIHCVLLAGVVLYFPLQFQGLGDANAVHSPLLWLMVMLVTSVGLPYFAISATSPLLQRWFSHTGHEDAANPYFLYAASNVGSMAALLLYPFLIEPLASLAEQVYLWQTGIILLAVCFFGVALTLLRNGISPLQTRTTVETQWSEGESPSWHTRLIWIMLAFVPSSLLYGVTTFVTTDIASVPLLWILPLALYLATFIMVFARRPRGIDLAQKISLLFIFVLLVLMLKGVQRSSFGIFMHIGGFFAITLALHGILARRKPDVRHLTEFFLWMSFGGVLGGVFNTLVAPFIFNSILEYPLALIAAALLQCALQDNIRTGWKKAKPLLIGLGSASIIGFVFVAGVVLIRTSGGTSKNELLQERSVFGVNRVLYNEAMNAHVFKHGTTLHGIQYLDEEKRLKPVSYYVGLEKLFDANPQLPAAVMGLGVGTLACYRQVGQTIDFYEIDPLVAQIAGNKALFTYMSDCPSTKKVILGDGRQRLEEQEDGTYGLIIIDAFSSDAIPVHLITQEALAIYRKKLSPDGVLALHITNRHIDLRPVLNALTADAGLSLRIRKTETTELGGLIVKTTWAVVARDEKVLDRVLMGDSQWVAPSPEPFAQRYLWRDDFSNLFFTLSSVRERFGTPKDSKSE